MESIGRLYETFHALHLSYDVYNTPTLYHASNVTLFSSEVKESHESKNIFISGMSDIYRENGRGTANTNRKSM